MLQASSTFLEIPDAFHSSRAKQHRNSFGTPNPFDALRIQRANRATSLPDILHWAIQSPWCFNGVDYYPLFDQQHLAKNNSFYPKKFPKTSLKITTFPRSGTHVVVGTFQEIFEEFIGLFENDQKNKELFDNVNGFLRPSRGFTRITSGHGFGEPLLKRAIFVARDPVEMVDSRSRFRLWHDPAKKKVVYKDGFYREPSRTKGHSNWSSLGITHWGFI